MEIKEANDCCWGVDLIEQLESKPITNHPQPLQASEGAAEETTNQPPTTILIY